MVGFVTPIQRIKTDTLCNVYIKREDLIPFSFGGNKVRIAYEYFEEMKKQGKDLIIGYGSLRSNFCRVLANMSCHFGIKCCIIMPYDNDDLNSETSNSQLVKFCDVDIVRCHKTEVKQTVDSTIVKYIDMGFDPYYIYGNSLGTGNKNTPVVAYHKVYNEIHKQALELGLDFDYIFLATGTGATQAGLIAGKSSSGGTEKIIGISVARNKQVAAEIIQDYLKCYFGKNLNTDSLNQINILDDYVQVGYGNGNKEILASIKEVYVKNGISLDITYTGKAYAGMINYIKTNNIKNKNILFLHTGGTPLFFNDLHNICEVTL